ncbi:MAG TPA: LssY C-terminal domain-containing protein [Gemmatimonadales bacterium]|nr:LssY C-terminal domain-containing protein [Gemmatimonadales bacterium]
MTTLLGAVLALVAGLQGSGSGGTRLPSGTVLPVRFIQTIQGGRDPVGTRVRVLTMEAVEQTGCAAWPAFAQAVGRVTVSHAGRIFGGRSALAVELDSLEVAPERWIAIDAVIEGLEYTPGRDVTAAGVVHGGSTSFGSRSVVVAGIVASDLPTAPLAILGGYWFARRGPPARIMAGELGRVRLETPVMIDSTPACASEPAPRPVAQMPDLGGLPTRTAAKGGRAMADPINLIFIGPRSEVDSAFRNAGWVTARRGSIGTVTKEIVRGLANEPDVGAPLSAQYLDGRRQDLAYELAGPNAKYRHHVRLWLNDGIRDLWVAAATEDIGIKINPLKGRFTHRIRPDVDEERDRIVQELEATGCAEVVEYIDLPGAVTQGRNYTGQRFVTDGRAAVLGVHSCPAPTETALAPGR